ncbi:exo-beta-N-acetylmuramidase NamZ family protein [Flavobacterium sp. NPDC079362]|uniref:exo-beta-N-acetylmuramidase NamZ family protein n=1 Tax=Flavobacterium sp. NPDC079362 TaxID=3390566 RepID=UPI003D00C4BB
MIRYTTLIFFIFLVTGNIKHPTQIVSSTHSTSNKSGIITGADQTEKYLPYLKGKRIGIVANQSSIIGKKSSVDSLVSLGIKIVKVFGPEHGFRGNASNGAVVGDEKDDKTGIPIISLYGKNEKPTKEQLADIDLLVFDIQDVGCRYYTNINTLEYVMEACAENNKELLILDRPNPNAYVVDGPVMTDDKFKSAIGIHHTPMTHGMTIGEFAQYLNGEGYLKKQCKIKIIKVANYSHDIPYVLPISPSPNLNTQQAVMLFPSLCMFEGTAINEGRGTYMPFTILGAPELKGKYSFSYKPVSIPGMSEAPNHKDAVCYGLDLHNYNIDKLRNRRQINLSWLIELYNAYPDKASFFNQERANTGVSPFDLRIGTDQLRKQIIAGVPEAEIRKSWEPGLQKFKAVRAKYLLYTD